MAQSVHPGHRVTQVTAPCGCPLLSQGTGGWLSASTCLSACSPPPLAGDERSVFTSSPQALPRLREADAADARRAGRKRPGATSDTQMILEQAGPPWGTPRGPASDP